MIDYNDRLHLYNVNVIQTSKSRLAAGPGATAHLSSPMSTTIQHDSAIWGTCRQEPVQTRLLIQRLTRFDYLPEDAT